MRKLIEVITNAIENDSDIVTAMIVCGTIFGVISIITICITICCLF